MGMIIQKMNSMSRTSLTEALTTIVSMRLIMTSTTVTNRNGLTVKTI